MSYGAILGQTVAVPDAYNIGDIKITTRTDLGNNWLLCNGDIFDETEYSELYNILPDLDYTNSSSWSNLISPPYSGTLKRTIVHNGIVYLYYGSGNLYTTTDFIDYQDHTLSATSNYYIKDFNILDGVFVFIESKTSWNSTINLKWSNSIDGPWTTVSFSIPSYSGYNMNWYGSSNMTICGSNGNYYIIAEARSTSDSEDCLVVVHATNFKSSTDWTTIIRRAASSIASFSEYIYPEKYLDQDGYVFIQVRDDYGYVLHNESSYYISFNRTNSIVAFQSIDENMIYIMSNLSGYPQNKKLDTFNKSTNTNGYIAVTSYDRPTNVVTSDNKYIGVYNLKLRVTTDPTFQTYDEYTNVFAGSASPSLVLNEDGLLFFAAYDNSGFQVLTKKLPTISFDGAYAYIKAQE